MDFAINVETDVKNFLYLLRENGVEVSAWWVKCEELMEKYPDGAKRESCISWKNLRDEVLEAVENIDSDEPSGLKEIRNTRPTKRMDAYDKLPSETVIRDRILAAWQGRISGCILGKPVECLMREKDSRAKLKEILTATNAYPLDDYIKGETMDYYWSQAKDKPSWFTTGNPSLRENIQYAPSDDDLNYTTISLEILKRFSEAFTPDDVLRAWLSLLPYGAVCTAEKIAYRNAVLSMKYPQTATFMNPYCEWIGAQIRTDLYGYIYPGQPEKAAELAFNDAACSHVRNGIYGAMWVSAAIAAGFMEDDPETVIRRGMEQIPENSRLYKHLALTIDACKANPEDYENVFDDIDERLGEYHCVHTINNACIVAAALILGGRDIGRINSIAVMGGLDTDCNGATAGSIAGAMYGTDAISARWIDCFNDTLHTAIVEHNVVKISDVAEKTFDWAMKLK